MVVFGAGGDDDMWGLFGVFDGVVDKVVNHVGDVKLVGEKGAMDVAEMGLDGALSVLNSELEVVYARLDDVVEVDFLRVEREFLA